MCSAISITQASLSPAACQLACVLGSWQTGGGLCLEVKERVFMTIKGKKSHLALPSSHPALQCPPETFPSVLALIILARSLLG